MRGSGRTRRCRGGSRGTAAGLAVVDEAQAAAGDSPEVRIARAKLYAAEPGRVRPLAPLAERIESWPEADQLRLLYGLVEVFDHTEDQAGVLQTLQRIAGRRPGDAAIWVRIHERAFNSTIRRPPHRLAKQSSSKRASRERTTCFAGPRRHHRTKRRK